MFAQAFINVANIGIGFVMLQLLLLLGGAAVAAADAVIDDVSYTFCLSFEPWHSIYAIFDQ